MKSQVLKTGSIVVWHSCFSVGWILLPSPCERNVVKECHSCWANTPPCTRPEAPSCTSYFEIFLKFPGWGTLNSLCSLGRPWIWKPPFSASWVSGIPGLHQETHVGSCSEEQFVNKVVMKTGSEVLRAANNHGACNRIL